MYIFNQIYLKQKEHHFLEKLKYIYLFNFKNIFKNILNMLFQNDNYFVII